MARKILLADDSVTAQNMGRKILADAGYEIITVNNGSAALKKIAELKPDLIVLDVYMPGYSGLEVCQRLKEASETSRIPVLLTVGKLEPFKPEEARRARADAFIVKPFEASELLSALTKLEEKIVPRAESSKPGRFARTIAAVEEGRYDKTMAPDEDSGWRARISFPSSKKKKDAASEDVDEASIYNPLNKDLRTVIERKISSTPPEARADAAKHPEPANEAQNDTKNDTKNETKNETKHQSRPEEARVDLGALASQGLPKDVTPEEIAALASAAAQITGLTVPGGTESARSEKEKSSGPAEPALQPAPAPQIEATGAGSSEAPSKESATATRAPEVVTSKSEMKDEPLAEKPPAIVAEDSAPASLGSVPPGSVPPASLPASSSDVAAAVGALESAASGSSENGFDSRGPGAQRSGAEAARTEGSRADRARVEEEPVTMAVATGANRGPAAPHWAAVSVALLPEESSLSLEHEMQKAHAAFAAAEMASTPAAIAVAEPPASNFSPIQAPVAESSIPAPPASLHDVAPPFTVTPIDATDAISAAVKELEATAAALAETIPSVSPMPQSAATHLADSVVPPAPQGSPDVEAKAAATKPVETTQLEAKPFEAKEESAAQTFAEREASVSASQEAASESAHSILPQPQPEIESRTSQATELKIHEDLASEAQAQDERIYDERTNRHQSQPEHPIEGAQASVPPAATASAAGEISESMATHSEPPSPLNEKPAEPVSVNPPADQSTSRVTEPLAASDSTPGLAEESIDATPVRSESAHKEPDIAATTAAAWASWRRVRESGDTRGPGSAKSPAQGSAHDTPYNKEEKSASSQDLAAMAAAAGAERAPDDVSAPTASDPTEIANIVDSVLADLRPKIVAEISKKIGKKK